VLSLSSPPPLCLPANPSFDAPSPPEQAKILLLSPALFTLCLFSGFGVVCALCIGMPALWARQLLVSIGTLVQGGWRVPRRLLRGGGRAAAAGGIAASGAAPAAPSDTFAAPAAASRRGGAKSPAPTPTPHGRRGEGEDDDEADDEDEDEREPPGGEGGGMWQRVAAHLAARARLAALPPAAQESARRRMAAEAQEGERDLGIDRWRWTRADEALHAHQGPAASLIGVAGCHGHERQQGGQQWQRQQEDPPSLKLHPWTPAVARGILRKPTTPAETVEELDVHMHKVKSCTVTCTTRTTVHRQHSELPSTANHLYTVGHFHWATATTH
jgi:hypothetical protein